MYCTLLVYSFRASCSKEIIIHAEKNFVEYQLSCRPTAPLRLQFGVIRGCTFSHLIIQSCLFPSIMGTKCHGNDLHCPMPYSSCPEQVQSRNKIVLDTNVVTVILTTLKTSALCGHDIRKLQSSVTSVRTNFTSLKRGSVIHVDGTYIQQTNLSLFPGRR
jgi:hypothetical protein